MNLKHGDKVLHKFKGVGYVVACAPALEGYASAYHVVHGGIWKTISDIWLTQDIVLNISEATPLERAIYDIPEDV